MSQLRVHDIKRERKKSLFLREISVLLQPILQEDSRLATLYPTRVDFSADTGICYVFFAAHGQDDVAGKALFKEALETLKLYKPSLRAALAQQIQSRYTPDLLFLYDEIKEKERKVNELLDKVHEELKNYKND